MIYVYGLSNPRKQTTVQYVAPNLHALCRQYIEEAEYGLNTVLANAEADNQQSHESRHEIFRYPLW
jgi:hypothetical protein